MKNPHGRRRCVVLGPRCITRSPRKRSTSHGGRSAGGRYSLAGRRSLAESRPSFLRDELRGRGPVRLGGDAATLPAASGEATAKEAAANSVSLAGRAARRRQKQCAHFPRPCPSGVDEKPGYKRRLPPPGGNASQHKKRKKAGHFYGGLPLPTMDRSLAHIEALRLSLSLSPRVMGNQSLERRERRKRPSTAASDCESTL